MQQNIFKLLHTKQYRQLNPYYICYKLYTYNVQGLNKLM